MSRSPEEILKLFAYNRGQAVTMLRQLGKAVEATDYLVFLDAGSA